MREICLSGCVSSEGWHVQQGYRPKRTAHDAIKRVAEAIVRRKTRVLDFDLRAYFDNVRHDRLLAKVARRIDDADVMHLLKVMLKASGKKGVKWTRAAGPFERFVSWKRDRS